MSTIINEISGDELVIFQGGNDPVMLQFPEDVSGYPDIHIILIDPGKEIWKHWEKTDLTFDSGDGSVVYAPLDQGETMSFPVTTLTLQARAYDTNGSVHNYSKLQYRVIERNDRHILPTVTEEES